MTDPDAPRDPRDWLVVDGHLQSVEIGFDPGDPNHRRAAELADRLIRGFPIACVVLAGSAALPAPNTAPRDLDLAVLLAPGAAAPAGIGERMRAAVRDGGALPVDLVAMRSETLCADPSLHLGTMLRSLVLAGALPWPSPVRLPARATGRALWPQRRDDLRRRLAALLRWLDAASDAGDADANAGADDAAGADLLLRVQKRALRLIAPVALALVESYTADLARCAELVAQLAPASAGLAAAVADDIARGAHDLDAASRAVDLAISMLGCESQLALGGGRPDGV